RRSHLEAVVRDRQVIGRDDVDAPARLITASQRRLQARLLIAGRNLAPRAVEDRVGIRGTVELLAIAERAPPPVRAVVLRDELRARLRGDARRRDRSVRQRCSESTERDASSYPEPRTRNHEPYEAPHHPHICSPSATNHLNDEHDSP